MSAALLGPSGPFRSISSARTARACAQQQQDNMWVVFALMQCPDTALQHEAVSWLIPFPWCHPCCCWRPPMEVFFHPLFCPGLFGSLRSKARRASSSDSPFRYTYYAHAWRSPLHPLLQYAAILILLRSYLRVACHAGSTEKPTSVAHSQHGQHLRAALSRLGLPKENPDMDRCRCWTSSWRPCWR